jgi:replication-associated recombination protein RarA
MARDISMHTALKEILLPIWNTYLEEVKNTVYYKPTNNGYESKIKMWLDKRRKDNK